MEFTRYSFHIFVSVLISCIHHILCYPDGPPLSVCDTGLPIHLGKNGTPYPPQTSPSPFQIKVNTTSYKPGDVIAVTVTSDVGEMFKGLFLQARKIRNDDEKRMEDIPVGSFHRSIVNTRIVSCELGMNTVTHTDPYLKMTTILNWRSPLLMNNDVVIRATVLTNFSTFWTNVDSQRIKLIRPEMLPAENMEKPWVEEIIKNVQAKEDGIKSRELVKSRFERGFKGVIDPNGYIMVHYVMDLLPFYSSHYGINTTQDNGIAIHIHVNTSEIFGQAHNTTITNSSSVADSYALPDDSKNKKDSKVTNNSTTSNNTKVTIDSTVTDSLDVNTSSTAYKNRIDTRNSRVNNNSTVTNSSVVTNRSRSTVTNNSEGKEEYVDQNRINSTIQKPTNVTDNMDAGRHNATTKTPSTLPNSINYGPSSGDKISKNGTFTRKTDESGIAMSRRKYEKLVRSVLADNRDAAKTLDTYLHHKHSI